MKGYHVTRRKNLDSIMEYGLIPNVPKDMEDLNAVYLFKTFEDAENALYNWLGQRIEEWEEENGEEYDEICLEVDLSDHVSSIIDTVEYEWACMDLIQPNKIINLIEI